MSIEVQQEQLRRQLEARGIQDQRVLTVIGRTHRELFVPENVREQAYLDDALPIAAGQTISQPYIVALMTQELGLTGDERVLEIGTGSGYQAAILSQLCREVVTVERIEQLSAQAREVLDRLGYRNIEFYVGDGTLGWLARAPYDGIIVTAAAPKIPTPLYEQLTEGGRMVIPVGDEAAQTLLVVERHDPEPFVREACGCRFVKLIGAAGWPED
ncbi:MAG: protein-L-isoaspartate(D-aspartate) O-methyltransferase [Pirellulales bacterium]